MALSPSDCYELTKENKAEVDFAEKEIDEYLKKTHYYGTVLKVYFSGDLNGYGLRALEKRYQEVGWKYAKVFYSPENVCFYIRLSEVENQGIVE